MTPDFLNSLAPEIEAIEQICKPRMHEMGQRFIDWGTALQASGQ